MSLLILWGVVQRELLIRLLIHVPIIKACWIDAAFSVTGNIMGKIMISCQSNLPKVQTFLRSHRNFILHKFINVTMTFLIYLGTKRIENG